MNRVDHAIIMAAGLGSRMNPVTLSTPKPLVIVNGVRIIDTIIEGLHKNNIDKIYIVVGYLKEKFECLLEDYNDITLVENPYFASCNNISSLYVVREFLEDAMILDGDQIIYNSDILNPEFERSGYNVIWNDNVTDEWMFFVENDIVKNCIPCGGKGGWQVYSVSRWTKSDGKKLKQHVENEFINKNNRSIYWDDIAVFCYPDDYELGIFEMNHGDIIEIDSYDELKKVDSTYVL